MGVLAREVVGVFAHVERADEDAARRLEPPHQGGVPRGGRVVAVDPRASQRRLPRDIEEILDREGHPGEEPARCALPSVGVDRVGLGERPLGGHGREGADRGIARGDPLQGRMGRGAGGGAAVPDGSRDGGGVVHALGLEHGRRVLPVVQGTVRHERGETAARRRLTTTPGRCSDVIAKPKQRRQRIHGRLRIEPSLVPCRHRVAPLLFRRSSQQSPCQPGRGGGRRLAFRPVVPHIWRRAISDVTRCPPPSPRTRAEQLAADLTQAIVTGALRPGERLDEHSIALRYGVSRTPVREALKRLAGLHLIELRPHRGAVVAALSAARVGELFEALAEAEAACARLAALKMSALERERLEAAHLAFRAAADEADPGAVPKANVTFHAAIHAGARNAFLAESVTTLRQRLAPFTLAQFELPDRPSQSAREHLAVLQAIHRGDGDGAGEAMRRHVMAVGRAWAVLAADAKAGKAAVKGAA
jgi:DNA-binding GntR family transcriptional regulator